MSPALINKLIKWFTSSKTFKTFPLGKLVVIVFSVKNTIWNTYCNIWYLVIFKESSDSFYKSQCMYVVPSASVLFWGLSLANTSHMITSQASHWTPQTAPYPLPRLSPSPAPIHESLDQYHILKFSKIFYFDTILLVLNNEITENRKASIICIILLFSILPLSVKCLKE